MPSCERFVHPLSSYVRRRRPQEEHESGAAHVLRRRRGTSCWDSCCSPSPLFLVLSLGSHHPQDPSLLHSVAADARAHNWAGSVGAQVSAVAFGFFGLTCFLIPLFLLIAGWRRLRRRDAAAGRGARVRRGAAARLGPGPSPDRLRPHRLDRRLDQDRRRLRRAARRLPAARLNLAGTLVVLASAVTLGTALAVQSTLGNVLAAWRDRCASSGRTGPSPASAATSGGRRSGTAGG